MAVQQNAPNTPPSPSFSHPPVVETVLSVQFDELKSFNTTHFGLYHETISDRYPVARDQPRLSPIAEVFPRRPAVPRLRLHTTPPLARVLFLDAQNVNLIQVQPDRFGFNWKGLDDQAPYPRFPKNSRTCLEEFGRFSEFCHRVELGEITPNLCEVVYVNHIWPTDDETAIQLFGDLFSGVTWSHSTMWLPPPEAATLNRVYVIGEQQGRLYAEASMATDRDRGDFIVVKIVGRVLCGPKDSVESRLQLAHDWVVHGFVSLTNERIREERWGYME